MRNIAGPPAEGDDFFDRESELSRVRRNLANQANLLLVAPRRVGKTSFTLRLCEAWAEDTGRATYFNVEGCGDEIDFAQTLIDSLQKAGVEPDFLPKLAEGFRRFRRAVSGVKVGVGVNVELSEVPDLDNTTLDRLLENILERVERKGEPILIAIDELPELLLTIARQEEGADRVSRFLHWLRSVRQTYRKHVRWMFLGSIGLDSFVDERNMRKTISDLTTVTLGEFDPKVADEFLEKLGDANGLPLNAEVRAAILQKVGWALPYHLQLIFHALADLEVVAVEIEHVDAAIEHLLGPENVGHFETWRQRLVDQFSKADADAARGILKLLCESPEGKSRAKILDGLARDAGPTMEIDVIEKRVADLLPILLRDGYVAESDGSYQFRSFLLREYWFRREIR
ncbi:MAG: ATP-binding protein [Planctomycetota bacterium]